MERSLERSPKRRRLEQAQNRHQNVIESTDQIHQILQFRQTIDSNVKTGINQFKDFLTALTKVEDLSVKSRYFHILRQYCTDQTASSNEEVDFPDIIATWSLAVQSNNDPICSAIPAALAQFYRTISGNLEFREFGTSLGHTLLKQEQLRLFDRGLSASKTREHLISPCLRLLTEIVSFDGGVLATRVFDHRDVLFKRLDFLLDVQNTEADAGRRKPSVRRMALRLLIANFKFLDAGARAELFAHGRILRNCLRGLVNDGDDIVVDVLKSVELGLLEEKDISRLTKSRILVTDTLTTLANLYDYEVDPEFPDSASNVRDAVHNLLLKICTAKKGILLPQTGWYPVAFDTRLDAAAEEGYINLGLDSPIHVDEYNSHIPLKNVSLAQFAQSLKPESDVLQSALLLHLLRSSPELIADYFSKKTKFSSLPSDGPTWRSHFGFLFSISQLPIPQNFGWMDEHPQSPPPVSIVVESILPRPLNRSTLSKYLNSDEEILVLSVARLLVVALQKLQSVIDLFMHQTQSNEWQQASSRLVEAVIQRVPKLQDVIVSLQQIGKDNDSIRLALSECLATYHRVLPETTVGSKFDIGTTLSNTLSRLDAAGATAESSQIFGDQVIHFATIAQLSHATNWWNKSDANTLSLFSQLLRFVVDRAEEEFFPKILTVLRSVIQSVQILNTDTVSFAALHLSIASTKKFEAIDETWLLLDNAIHRAVQRPVKYLDIIESVQQTVSDKKPLSLISAAVTEQWGFVVKKYADEKSILKNVAEWIVRFFSALESAGENFRVMQTFQDDMQKLAEGKTRDILAKAIQKGHKKPVQVAATADGLEATQKLGGTKSQIDVRRVNLNEAFGVPLPNPDSLEGIDHWDDKTRIELAIQSNKVAKLIRCSASSEEETRRQAFQSLQSLAHIVDQSTYDEKVQMYLLLGELNQTIRQHGLQAPLPSLATELAVRLLQIIADPAHKMYGKSNKFLLRSPVWDLKRLISYWVREILYQEPESEDVGSWSEEMEWLLQLLIDGLKTRDDMELYRRSGVLERVLTVYTKPGLPRPVRRLILILIWRTISVGGADMLITRAGIRSWLHTAGLSDREHQAIFQELDRSVSEACDEGQIDKWEKDLPVLRAE